MNGNKDYEATDIGKGPSPIALLGNVISGSHAYGECSL
jgi:hypothetical protein